MPRRLILTADNRSIYDGPDGHWKYCVPMVEAYAKLHEIDYKFVELKEAPPGRHIAWSKITLFQTYAPEYDEIIWIDSDAIVNNMKVDIFDALKQAPCRKEWERDTAVSPVLYAITDGTFTKGACTGIMLLDCRDKARVITFLQDWWDGIPDPKYAMEHPWEQSVINNNWIHVPEKRNLVYVSDLPSFNVDEEIPGQVFLHISNAMRDVRLFCAKKFYYRMIVGSAGCDRRKVGIFIRKQDLYSNGIGQNCIFLRQTLEAAGHDVKFIVLNMDRSDGGLLSKRVPYLMFDFNEINPAEYCAFITGSMYPPPEIFKTIRAAGAKSIYFNCSNVQMFHTEKSIYSCRADKNLQIEQELHKYFDECWITDPQCESSQNYMHILNRGQLPIRAIPLVWDPLFLKQDGVLPKYAPRTGAKLHIVIIEPNLNYCKSALLPIFAAEKVHLDNPSMIAKVHLFNTPDKNPTFMSLMHGTKLHEDRRITYYGRMHINEILHFFANPKNTGGDQVVFVSHQIHLPINYAYFDVLYTGFPFVHNSPALRDAKQGYYYHDLDLFGASAAILEAHLLHSVEPAMRSAHAWLDTYHPHAPKNVARVQALMDCKTRTDQRKQHALQHPIVLSYDNAPTENTLFFEDTLKKNKWEYKLIGKGDVWKGWPTRTRAYKAALDSMYDDQVVVISDARDVICMRSPRAFMEAFAEFGTDIVASSELFCEGREDPDERPEVHTQCMPLRAYWKHRGFETPPDRQFINAGLLCGKAKALRAFYAWALEKGFVDDQLALGSYALAYPDRILCDHEAKLLHTTNFGVNAGIQSIKKQARDSPSFAEMYGRGAFFLHIPGCVNKGQKEVYESVKRLVQSGVSDAQIRTPYGFPEPTWNETFLVAPPTAGGAGAK